MSSKKKSQPKDIPTVTKKNKATMTRTERKEEERKEELQIEEEKPFSLNDQDKANIKHQCEHMDKVTLLSTVNSFIVKYAVCYRGTWLFVLYNREKHRLVDFIDMSFLSNTEKNAFQLFKNRIELERRRQIATPAQEVRPVVMVRQVPPPNGFSSDDDDE